MKYVDTMPWAGNWPWSKPGRCKARLKKGKDPAYFGRCELTKGHNNEWEDPDSYYFDHCLERGMVWVRWNKHGVRYEQPTYKED